MKVAKLFAYLFLSLLLPVWLFLSSNDERKHEEDEERRSKILDTIITKVMKKGLSVNISSRSTTVDSGKGQATTLDQLIKVSTLNASLMNQILSNEHEEQRKNRDAQVMDALKSFSNSIKSHLDSISAKISTIIVDTSSTNQATINPRPKVVNTTTKTVSYDEKLGDDEYAIGLELENSLTNQPDRFLWVKNKTKENLIIKILEIYESALSHYAKAGSERKYQEIEAKIAEFMRAFKVKIPLPARFAVRQAKQI